MKQPERDKIYVGLKFASIHFAAAGEIVAIREDINEIDIRLTDTQGHARIEKGWNLQHTKCGFERGEYLPIDPEKDKVNISII